MLEGQGGEAGRANSRKQALSEQRLALGVLLGRNVVTAFAGAKGTPPPESPHLSPVPVLPGPLWPPCGQDAQRRLPLLKAAFVQQLQLLFR